MITISWNEIIPPGVLADFSLTIFSHGVTIRNDTETQDLPELTSNLKSCIKGFKLSVKGKIGRVDLKRNSQAYKI